MKTLSRDGVKVAVVGATGAVGRELISCLDALEFPVSELRLLASARSSGKFLETPWGNCRVEDVEHYDFRGADLALFSAGKSVSFVHGPRAVAAGALVVDNSSAFRMDVNTALIVPEVNGELLSWKPSLIANPNCSTIQLVLALKALDQVAGVESVRVATYQSCSGAGQRGMEALREESQALLMGLSLAGSRVHARPIAFDVVPQIGAFNAEGFSEEEEKMMRETRKILGKPNLGISATCVRVPVFRGHSEVVHVTTAQKITLEKAAEALASMPGLVLTPLSEPGHYPTARQAEGRFESFVGRLREDPVDARGLIFWIVSDNLLKGAALNAVQIALAAWKTRISQ